MRSRVSVAELEGALLARGAARRGRHLRVRCPDPAHRDERPSCDVDLGRGFVCRSCGRSGGLRALASLLGLAPLPPRPRGRRPERAPDPPAGLDAAARPEEAGPEAWAEAWEGVEAEARRQAQRLAPHRAHWAVADWLRGQDQAIRDARRLASGLGDTEAAWRLLAAAARAEDRLRVLGAALDAV